MTNLNKLKRAISYIGVSAAAATILSTSAFASKLETEKVHYRTTKVDNVDVFYRESGDAEKPVVLLLHGFPTSSHMYRNLIPELATDYHVIAPDLPGFGSTIAPKRGGFDYNFNNLYKVIEKFTQNLNLESYAVMTFDYGAPIGFRLAAANPEKVTALISQNGNVYEEGLQDSWGPFRTYWESPTKENRDALRGLLSKETTFFQYTHGVPDNRLSLVSPDARKHDQEILDRDPELQLDLFRDYKTNVALYPKWQAYMKKHQPPMLAVWGKNDPFFGPEGANAFKRDLPKAEVHLFDTGHFALETHGDEIAVLIKEFLSRNVK